ncbi:NADP-dependent oxidoreductase domain-containing protein [Cladochytrium replicatum]|nr:NADP-dependent oxidoreductase domain-containing protein [Cladochytrium replicatum]
MSIPPILLRDGNKIPAIGLGVWQARGAEVVKAVELSIRNGYRHIDTAELYGNEHEVGEGIRASGVPREEIFITTKVWITNLGYEKTIAAFEKSLRKLQTSYVDLYLIHGPQSPKLQPGTWKALEELQAQGKIKSVGVSNFNIHHLEKMRAFAEVMPVVNQVEVTPYLPRRELAKYCQDNGILVEAYSPLTQGRKLNDPRLLAIAHKYGKSAAQILIKWGLQQGMVSLPKSVKENRIVENSDVYDFEISEADMKLMESFEDGFVAGWDPTNLPW